MKTVQINELPNGATRRTMWGKPNEIVMAELEECVRCGKIREDGVRQCCQQLQFRSRIVFSEYGQVTYREFCLLEIPRFRANGLVASVEIDKKTSKIALFARERKKWTRQT